VHSGLYRLVPKSRRPRAVRIGDRIFGQVGGYVLGNVLISLVAGTVTFVWLLIFRVPYPLLLAIMVALLDLIRSSTLQSQVSSYRSSR
jgi:predicted PurR-regulated permease PerM